ncbi:lipopolysaccharide biosynthesis protein [Loktanella agnita]|uniref:lipopolysaccharide biosynthesis protein n=1 Tax=Loktanella agnita TaxID=287097 RepID=UPI003986D348
MAEAGKVILSKRLVMINAASSVLSKLISVTVILWTYQYLLKRISTEEFAVLPVVGAMMVFAPLFFSFFTGGISRYVTAAYALGDDARITQIISSIMVPLAAAALAFIGLGLVFAAHIDAILNIAPHMVGQARMMMALLVISYAFQMLATPYQTGFHVHQKFIELNLLGVARDLLRMVLLLVLLLGVGPQVIWVVTATVIAETLYALVTYTRGKALVPQLQFRPAAFNAGQARQLFSFGLWTTVGRLGSVMYTHAATLVLNIYGSAADVTSYHIGSTFFRQMESVISLASLPLQPAMTAMHTTGDTLRLRTTLLRGGRYALWVSLAVAVPLMIYADDFIDIYLGPGFSQAVSVTILFMIMFPFTKPTQLLGMLAIANGQVRAFYLPAFLFQLLGLVLMLIFVRMTDQTAIAATLALTLITIGSQVSYYWRMCLRMAQVNLAEFTRQVLIPGHLPALAGGAMWITLKLIEPPTDWTSLIAVSLTGGVVYLIVLYAFCLEPQDRRAVARVFGRQLA